MPLVFRYGRIAAAAMFIGLTGCYVPLKSVAEGTEIASRDLKWVKAGETDRAEILARFGVPDIDFVDRRTIAYAWSGNLGALCGYDCVTLEMRRALMIRFDAAGKVSAFSIIDRPLSPMPVPRYDALEGWRTREATGWIQVLDQWLAGPGAQTASGR